jgi:hypothetical protein
VADKQADVSYQQWGLPHCLREDCEKNSSVRQGFAIRKKGIMFRIANPNERNKPSAFVIVSLRTIQHCRQINAFWIVRKLTMTDAVEMRSVIANAVKQSSSMEPMTRNPF